MFVSILLALVTMCLSIILDNHTSTVKYITKPFLLFLTEKSLEFPYEIFYDILSFFGLATWIWDHGLPTYTFYLLFYTIIFYFISRLARKYFHTDNITAHFIQILFIIFMISGIILHY